VTYASFIFVPVIAVTKFFSTTLIHLGGLHALLVLGQRLGQHHLGKHGLLFGVPVALRQQDQVVGDLGEGGFVVDMDLLSDLGG